MFFHSIISYASPDVEKWHDQYLNLLNSQDEKLIELFADDAIFNLTMTKNGETTKEIKLLGKDVKSALESSWPLIKELKDTETVDERNISSISEGVYLISGVRKSKLKCTEDKGFQMKVREKGSSFEIIELTESSEHIYQCPETKGITSSTLLLLREVGEKLKEMKLPIRFYDYSQLRSMDLEYQKLKVGLRVFLKTTESPEEIEKITDSFKTLMCEFPFNRTIFQLGGESEINITYILKDKNVEDSFPLTSKSCQGVNLEVDKKVILSLLEKTIDKKNYPQEIDENISLINVSVLNEKLVINYDLKEFDEKNQDEFLKFTKKLEEMSKDSYRIYLNNGVPIRMIFSKSGDVVKVLDLKEGD